MNTVKCKDCAHFEQHEKYRGGKRTDVWYGWCRKRSVYPALEWDAARPFDVDVTRVTRAENRSKPFVVDAAGTIESCTDALARGR
jgi:hypothetical protein